VSGIPPSAPTGVAAPRPEDPSGVAGSDKRTLFIAIVVMFSLVLVGVVSGALFNRSPCAIIDPDPVAAGASGGAGSVDEVLAASYPGSDDVVRENMAAGVDSLTEQLGPISGIAEVTGANSLGSADDGIAALGPVTTLLDASGSDVLARSDVGEGQVVGSGGTLYAVDAVNELTGQVDAVVPLDGQLEGPTCVNTSLINSPLAFALDAGEGELLLLRINEDGGEPVLELRDAVEGRVWGAPLEIGIAPPGVQGERLTGRLGADLVVTGRRTIDGDEHPLLTAVDRPTGEMLWTVDRNDLGELVASDVPEFVEVLAVGTELALVGLSPDSTLDESDAPVADETPTRLVAVDTADGSLLWEATLAPGDDLRHAVVTDERSWVVVAQQDGTIGFEGRDAAGESIQSIGSTGGDGRVAALADGRAIAVTADAVAVVSDEDRSLFALDLAARDVVAHGRAVTVLFEGPDDGSITVTYSG
jgi:hypothetical protein